MRYLETLSAKPSRSILRTREIPATRRGWKSTTPALATATCLPAPLPSPSIALLSPANGDIGVSPALSAIAFTENGATPTTVTLIPASGSSGGPIVASNITVVAGSATSAPTVTASFVGPLTVNTPYTVTVVSQLGFGGCFSSYTQTVGSFTTGMLATVTRG